MVRRRAAEGRASDRRAAARGAGRLNCKTELRRAERILLHMRCRSNNSLGTERSAVYITNSVRMKKKKALNRGVRFRAFFVGPRSSSNG